MAPEARRMLVREQMFYTESPQQRAKQRSKEKKEEKQKGNENQNLAEDVMKAIA